MFHPLNSLNKKDMNKRQERCLTTVYFRLRDLKNYKFVQWLKKLGGFWVNLVKAWISCNYVTFVHMDLISTKQQNHIAPKFSLKKVSVQSAN